MTKGRTIIFYQTNPMLLNHQTYYAILRHLTPRTQGQLGGQLGRQVGRQLGKKAKGKEEMTYVKGQINRS